MNANLTKANIIRDHSGYYSTGHFLEKKPQELTLVANTHAEFTALTYEVIELTTQVDLYYLISAAGTAATADGNACFFLQQRERKEIICNVGDIVSCISSSPGKINLVEKG